MENVKGNCWGVYSKTDLLDMAHPPTAGKFVTGSY